MGAVLICFADVRPSASFARSCMVKQKIRSTIVIALLSAAAGCSRSEPSAAIATPVESSPVRMTPRALALAKTKENAPVDVLIAALQTSLERNSERPDYWILLGRAWVRKARESSDSGFYLNADACATVA